MASKLPLSAQASISKCELCDRDNYARWFCEDCDEEMCKQCRTIHLRSKATKSHNIIAIATDKDDISGDFAPKKPILCSSHLSEQVQLYCIDCETLVCLTCIADKKHKHHSLDKIPNIIAKFRDELLQCITEIQQDISELQSSSESIESCETSYLSQSSKIVDQINIERRERKSQIDTIADSLILQVKERECQDLQTLRDQILHIRKWMSDKTDELQICQDTLQSFPDFSIIALVADIKQRHKQCYSIPPPSCNSPSRFVRSDLIDLHEIFGHLETNKNDKMSLSSFSRETGVSPTIDTTILANINPCISSRRLSAVNDRLVWCGEGYGNGNDVALVNIAGQLIDKVQMDANLYDLATPKTGELIFTEINGHHIKKYTVNREFLNIIDTSPYQTRGLCLTSDGDILVCLYKDRSSSKILRLTSEGRIQQTIQNNEHNRSLFTYPMIVTENVRKDICVVDDYKTVAVVKKESVLRFRYPSSSAKITIRRCYGIVCDKLGYILISDRDNHRIHQVDKEGQLTQYILTKQHGIYTPWGLSIDDKGKLWICNNDGKEVKVVKYRSQ